MSSSEPWFENPFWTDPLEAYREYRSHGIEWMFLDLATVDRAIMSEKEGMADISTRLVEALRSLPEGDGSEHGPRQLLLAFLAKLQVLSREAQPSAQQLVEEVGRPLSISLAPSSDPLERRAGRVLAMVHELHKAGYQRLRIAAGRSPSGMHWRCHIIASNNVKPNGWEPFDWEDAAFYTSGQSDKFFDWQDAPGKSARELAVLFLERFPKLAHRGQGRDPIYAGWFVGMLGAAEHGRLPQFYADYDLKSDPAEMPPPPDLPIGSWRMAPIGEDPNRFHRGAPLRRSGIWERQAKFMARLIREMEGAVMRAYGVSRVSDLTWTYGTHPEPWEIPEVMRFIEGSMACGFVYNDYHLNERVDLDKIHASPGPSIRALTPFELRRYILTVQRADKWADGYSSPILSALACGALQLVATRLDGDASLYDES